MGYLDDIGKVLGGKEDQNPNAKSAKPKSQITVLIVEDEPILREMYRDKFVHEGFKVITGANGQEGLDLTMLHKPNIILLDLMMPVMDGKLMLHKLREIPMFKKLPVIILTNAGEVDNIKETKHYDNANEFLIKSNVSVDEVVKKVKEWTYWDYNK